jgi:hypothetical protein
VNGELEKGVITENMKNKEPRGPAGTVEEREKKTERKRKRYSPKTFPRIV